MPREIKVPFGIDNTGGIATVSDPVEVGQQHLTTFVATSPRERVMRPDFGSPAQRYLFEPAGTLGLNLLGQEMLAQVSTYVQDVQVVNIALDPAPLGRAQDGALGISLTFVLATAAQGGTSATGTATVVVGGAQ